MVFFTHPLKINSKNNIITSWFFYAEQDNLDPQESLNFNTSYIHNEQDIADIKAEAEAFEAEEEAEVQASEFAPAGKQPESEAARNARLEGERQADALRSGRPTGKIEAMQKQRSLRLRQTMRQISAKK